MRAQGQSAGLQQMRQVLARMAKDEMGLKLQIWRTLLQDDNRIEQMARLRTDLEVKASSAREGAGLLQMKQILARLSKGEMAMRLEIWRQLLKMDSYRSLYAKYEQDLAQSALEKESVCAELEHLLQAIFWNKSLVLTLTLMLTLFPPQPEPSPQPYIQP